ncbi:mechanosensitive ion channel domain-containing protein [Sulfurovum sp.]|uniref:mechanosensitive ion channel domain-containing protein n=1 Tax=Sulfurovum sp. TaxID=1969726 RepID=UPI002867EB25|nr:mechanosensitive ion channel domain-containing protein [Sulfurovum sp.]
MKRDSVQDFLRIILMTGMLFLLGAQWSFGAEVEEKNSKTISPVSPEVLKSQIKNVETTDLSEEDKKNLTELYTHALANIEKARYYATDAESFKKARKTAPEAMEKLRNTLKEREKISPEKILKALEETTLPELVQQQEKEKADLSAVEAKLSDLNNQIVIQNTRPTIARERLIELKRRVDATITPAKPSGLEGDVALMTQAEEWVQETQTFMLSSEIKMLDQELLSHQGRMKLLKLQQDVAESKVKNVTERVRFMDDLLNKRRFEEARLVQQQVETTKEESKDKHLLIRKLAEENVALGEKLKMSTLDLEDVSAKEGHNRESAKRIGDNLSSINQKLKIAGMNQDLGKILIKQRKTLPNISMIQTEISQLKQHISNSGLEQIQYAEEYKHLRDIDSYLAEFTEGIPQNEADTIRTELKELALIRQALLSQVMELKSSYSRALGELDSSLRKLMDVVKAYDDFLAENLLWIRSTKPISLSLFKSLPEELEQLLSSSNWIHVANILTKQFKSTFIVSFLLLVLLVLFFMRRYFLRAVVATNEKIRSIRTDHFTYTVQAVVLTALASLPLSLLFMITGWQLSLVPEATEFSNAVSAALLRGSPYFFYLLFFTDLAIPEGVVVKHFRWSAKIASKLHSELKLLMVLVLPSLFIVVYSITQESIEFSSTFTLLGLLCIVGSIGLFLFRTFTPAGGVLAKYFEENADHLMVRLRFVWEKFFIALMILIVILVLLGYIHTATVLTHNLFVTVWLIYALALIQGLIARWLLLVNRRLEVQAILTRREEARLAKGAMEKNDENDSDQNAHILEFDEPEADLVDLSLRSRKLLYAILFSGGAVGLWFIWSPLLPALNFLNDISIWSSTVMVDGVKTMVPVTLGDLILAIIVIIVTTLASRGLPALLEFVLLQNKNTTVGGRYTITTLFRYVIVGVGTLLFFNIIGASWSQIQWLAAALSVGIGFGLQEIVANFISGLIILFERPIRVGDTVTVGTTTGVVSRIQIRATTITNWDRQELLVPNKAFITQELLNWTLSDPIVRVVIPVGIAYGSDVSKAMELLMEAAHEHDSVIESPNASVIFTSFDDNSLKLTLRAFISSVDNRTGIITDLHQAINRKFNESGISIAFPQRDVHFDTSKPIDIRVYSENNIQDIKE